MSIKYNGGYIPAVGADGTTLVANSASATGVAWAGPSVAAGKNIIINGGMDIWQRGTSFTVQGNYAADRWWLPNVAGTTTVSRDTDVPTGLAGQYSMKQLTAAGSSYAQYATYLENATIIPFQGKTVVLSWYMKANSTWSNTFGPLLFYSNSTDARASQLTAVTYTAVTGITPTTSWARYYGTFTVPTDAQGFAIQFNPAVAQASGASLNIAGVQLENGSVPTSFSRAGGTLSGELTACQRYFIQYNTDSSYQPFSMAHGISTDSVRGIVSFPVTLRTNPTFTSSAASTFQKSFGSNTFTAVAAAVLGTKSSSIDFTRTAEFLANGAYLITSAGAASAFLAFSAEL